MKSRGGLVQRALVIPLALAVAGSVLGADAGVSAAPTPAARSSCSSFIISGGRSENAVIQVDDDLTIQLLPKRGAKRYLLNDRDGLISDNMKDWQPIQFRAATGDRLKIAAYDGEPPNVSLTPLWIHCKGGASEQITSGVKQKKSPKNDKKPFFKTKYRIPDLSD